MLKEKLQKALMNAYNIFFALPNYATYEYFGLVCGLEANGSYGKLTMRIECAAIRNSLKEELTQEDIVELCEEEVVENVDLREFKQLLIDSASAYKNQIFFLIPEIVSWIYVKGEQPTLEETLNALNDCYVKKDPWPKNSIIGFRIENRAF